MNATVKNTRIEARVSIKKKERFQKVAELGGFKTFSDFVVNTLEKEAELIEEKHNKLLASEKDRELFFNALLTPEEPNEALKSAFDKYND